MTESRHFAPAAWMNTPNRLKLFAALGVPEVDVRYVGGCVRNWLMDRAITDIDIATPDVPDQVLARLKQAGIKAVPTGIDHGTVTAVMADDTAEITTLRRDTACDGRHAAVEFTGDWQEDARRRDFTMNALSLSPDGRLFDYHGGLADARAGRVRFVGNAADRIQEDYLRILRLFRFFAWYGHEPIDGATLAAVEAHSAGLVRLSTERIAQELAKLLAAPDPAEAVLLMAKTSVLGAILPPARDGQVIAALVAREREAAIGPDWLRRLATLLPQEQGEPIAQRLKLSNPETDRLKALTAGTPTLTQATTSADLDSALYRYGAAIIRDRLLLSWVVQDGASAPWLALLERASQWIEKKLPVSGADVLALGLAPGPAVGRLLSEVEAWWVSAGFVDRARTLAELHRRAAHQKK